MLMNEKIKVSEVELTGINGEPLGIMPTSEALALAKKLKVDLVCTSLMSSPPPCKLIGAGDAKREKQQAKAAERGMKVKEIRLTPQIEEHDFETKLRQAEKTLKSGNAVLFVIRIKGKEGAAAKELLERLITDLKEAGTKMSGIQLSGKQASVQLHPR